MALGGEVMVWEIHRENKLIIRVGKLGFVLFSPVKVFFFHVVSFVSKALDLTLPSIRFISKF